MVGSGSTERPGPEIDSPDPVPPGLLEAFRRYDAALIANDKSVLGELYLPAPVTLCGDGRNLLVGHAAISGFRSARSAVPVRKVTALHIRVLSAGHALIMARTADGAATGLQTQVWQLTEAGWRVAAAHVTLPSAPASATVQACTESLATASPASSFAAGGPAFDRSVWRVVGAPWPPRSATGRSTGTT